ncbi:hypothetical protein LINPERHAP1_LOCUS23476 [Linum perenne]
MASARKKPLLLSLPPLKSPAWVRSRSGGPARRSGREAPIIAATAAVVDGSKTFCFVTVAAAELENEDVCLLVIGKLAAVKRAALDLEQICDGQNFVTVE